MKAGSLKIQLDSISDPCYGVQKLGFQMLQAIRASGKLCFECGGQTWSPAQPTDVFSDLDRKSDPYCGAFVNHVTRKKVAKKHLINSRV